MSRRIAGVVYIKVQLVITGLAVQPAVDASQGSGDDDRVILLFIVTSVGISGIVGGDAVVAQVDAQR